MKMLPVTSFMEKNKVGESAFGTVYKGTLPNGEAVAVKKFSKNFVRGEREFTKVACSILPLQHDNLAKIIGLCTEDSQCLLVYEYLQNQSLDRHIFDPEKRARLDWPTRSDIIQGVARGLCFLHENTQIKIIHGDLKAGNILLAANMIQKISDYWVSKLVKLKKPLHKASGVSGTQGYMAPEYTFHGSYSEKSDVFSFGVLVLEIISGLSNSSSYRFSRSQGILGYVWSLWVENRQMQFLDAVLVSSVNSEELKVLMHVALLCVQEEASDRPTMSKVIDMIKGNSDLSEPSLPPLFLRTTSSGIISDSVKSAFEARPASAKKGVQPR